jgi:hypothetical protein
MRAASRKPRLRHCLEARVKTGSGKGQMRKWHSQKRKRGSTQLSRAEKSLSARKTHPSLQASLSSSFSSRFPCAHEDASRLPAKTKRKSLSPRLSAEKNENKTPRTETHRPPSSAQSPSLPAAVRAPAAQRARQRSQRSWRRDQ